MSESEALLAALAAVPLCRWSSSRTRSAPASFQIIALARRYVDALGTLNQRVSAAVSRVVFMAAGLPLVVKPSQLPEISPVNAPTRIPATIVTGFLGAGKTTLIRNLVEKARWSPHCHPRQ